MRRDLLLILAALAFLAIAVVSGALVSRETASRNVAGQAVESGLHYFGSFMADILWLKLDQYHHIWMYQGTDWSTATDYLPHLWLIVRLDPNYVMAYVDGGYHLAVNLGAEEEGIELLERGLRYNPRDEALLWEYAVVLWATEYYGPRRAAEASWDYLDLTRRNRGMMAMPWNEPNAQILLRDAFRRDSLRANADRIAERYQRRSEFIRDANRVDMWFFTDSAGGSEGGKGV